jgi:hypothetical protein
MQDLNCKDFQMKAVNCLSVRLQIKIKELQGIKENGLFGLRP